MSYVFVEDEGINDQRSIEFDVCSKYLPYDRMRRTGWFEFKTFVVCKQPTVNGQESEFSEFFEFFEKII